MRARRSIRRRVAVVTVAATALGVWLDFPMPGLDDVYPDGIGWLAASALYVVLSRALQRDRRGPGGAVS